MSKTLKQAWFDGYFKYHEFRSKHYIKRYIEKKSYAGLTFIEHNPMISFQSIASYTSPAASYEERKQRLDAGEIVRMPWVIELEKNKPGQRLEAIQVYEHLISTYGIDAEDIIIWITPAGSIYIAVNPQIYDCTGTADQLSKRNKNITRSIVQSLGLTTVDLTLYDPQRIIRTWNSRYSYGKGGRSFVVPIHHEQLYQMNLRDFTGHQVDLNSIILPCQPAPDWLDFVRDSEQKYEFDFEPITCYSKRNCVEYFYDHPKEVHIGIRNQVIVSMAVDATQRGQDDFKRIYEAASQFEGHTSDREINKVITSVERHNTKFSCERVKEYLSNSNIDSENICANCPFAMQQEQQEIQLHDFMLYADHAETIFRDKWPIQDIELYFEMSKQGFFRQETNLLDLDQYTKRKYNRICQQLSIPIDQHGYAQFNRIKGYKIPNLFLHVAKTMGGVRLRQFLLLITKAYTTVQGGYLSRISKNGIQAMLGLSERAYYYMVQAFKEKGLVTFFSSTMKLTFGISKLADFAKPKKLQSESIKNTETKLLESQPMLGLTADGTIIKARSISISNVLMYSGP